MRHLLTEKRGRQKGRVRKSGNEVWRKKGSGPEGQRRAIGLGLTVKEIDVDTDRFSITRFDVIRRICNIAHYPLLSFAFPYVQKL